MNERPCIEINIKRQTLYLSVANQVLRKYSVSTAKNGCGELAGSECTPRGRHVISEKIGAGCAVNSIFVGRQVTGQLYHPGLRRRFPDRDWILTRILRLRGQESGINQGGNVDSHERFIYIHGSPDEVSMGIPGSKGCIRMHNQNIIELFDLVAPDTPVMIAEK